MPALRAPSTGLRTGRQALLLASVFVVAICGLSYELCAGAFSSYLVGSSVTHFSLVIGLFMFAMGIGSFLSRYVRRDALRVFVAVEIAVGVAGGTSGLLLFYAFTFLGHYLPVLFLTCLSVGVLVGLEIPLVIRILKEQQALASVIASVLAVDYIGALLASLLFPLLLMPFLGLVRSGFVFGLLNVAVAGLAVKMMAKELRRRRILALATGVAAILMLVGLVTAGGLTRWAEDALYQDEIVLARDTPYQRIVVTRWRDDIRLFLNGHLQLASSDEARYHESLVYPVMAAVPGARRVLILGGGDGMAAREVLAHPGVQKVDLVDLDKEVPRLFTEIEMLARLNRYAFTDPRLHLHVDDAAKFLEKSAERWDVVIVDLPDPSTAALARLYSRSFYRLLGHHLAEQGAFVTQAASPFYAPEAFWCITHTIEKSGNHALGRSFWAYPYHVNVPSFGEWGFVLASRRQLSPESLLPRVTGRFLTAEVLPSFFLFPKDLKRRTTEVNRFDQPVLVRYYERGWSQFNN